MIYEKEDLYSGLKLVLRVVFWLILVASAVLMWGALTYKPINRTWVRWAQTGCFLSALRLSIEYYILLSRAYNPLRYDYFERVRQVAQTHGGRKRLKKRLLGMLVHTAIEGFLLLWSFWKL